MKDQLTSKEDKITLTPATSSNSKFKEVYGLNYFYENFENKYSPKMMGEKKGVRPKKIAKSLYKKILLEYLDIYYKEIYFFTGPSYFLYTGILEKVKYSPRIIINKGVKKMINSSIGFMWYQRPSELFFICCKLVKLTGKTNRLPEIEKTYKNNFDVNLIVNFEDAIGEQKRNNNNYIL
jgi:hypothetical protein